MSDLIFGRTRQCPRCGRTPSETPCARCHGKGVITDPVGFDGATYVPERKDDPGSDRERLASQLNAVAQIMGDGKWHRLEELAQAIPGATTPSISARIRDLRKPRFGGHLISRRYVERGLFEYRLVLE